jgi:DNA-binding winged helix-turn-helix (wHTH) protein
LYEFGAFRVDPSERLLLCGEDVISLTPKVFETLLVLIENCGHVLGKEELMQQVWPDSYVEENNLAQNISILRKILAEHADGMKYIETVPKRGYRFIAQVTEVGERTDVIVRERTRARIVIEEETEDGDFRAGPVRRREALAALAPARIAGQALQPEIDAIIHRAPETRYATSAARSGLRHGLGLAPRIFLGRAFVRAFPHTPRFLFASDSVRQARNRTLRPRAE